MCCEYESYVRIQITSRDCLRAFLSLNLRSNRCTPREQHHHRLFAFTFLLRNDFHGQQQVLLIKNSTYASFTKKTKCVTLVESAEWSANLPPDQTLNVQVSTPRTNFMSHYYPSPPYCCAFAFMVSSMDFFFPGSD